MAEGPRIAILGWGSLLWEPNEAFDRWHGGWLPDGPKMKLEFSRISKSRLGALTLVIDEDNGSLTQVSYCFSKRQLLEDAIADLRCREGTSLKQIGFVDLATSQERARSSDIRTKVSTWLNEKHLKAAVWTDLESNFAKICGSEFSVNTAIGHLKSLQRDAKVKAAEYIWRAPEFVQTGVREAIEIPPWFEPRLTRNEKKQREKRA